MFEKHVCKIEIIFLQWKQLWFLKLLVNQKKEIFKAFLRGAAHNCISLMRETRAIVVKLVRTWVFAKFEGMGKFQFWLVSLLKLIALISPKNKIHQFYWTSF